MSNSSLVSARFHLVAEGCPGLLARLMQPLAKRDLTADVFHAERDGDFVRVEIVLEAMPAEMVHLVAGNFGQTFGVMSLKVESGQALRIAA